MIDLTLRPDPLEDPHVDVPDDSLTLHHSTLHPPEVRELKDPVRPTHAILIFTSTGELHIMTSLSVILDEAQGQRVLKKEGWEPVGGEVCVSCAA